jgi:hypothetical protein
MTHTDTRQDFSGLGISLKQRPLPDNTQHSQKTNIHSSGAIWTRSPSKRADTRLLLRPRSHWDRRNLQHWCTVALLHCRIVALSHCCTVALLHYRIVALSHCCTVELFHCRIVSLSHCCTVALLHCRIVALSNCCTVALLHCRIVACLVMFVVRFHRGIARRFAPSGPWR